MGLLNMEDLDVKPRIRQSKAIGNAKIKQKPT